jgi:WD40 repeat protein
MVMAVAIFHHLVTANLTVIAGYESGHTTISQFTSSQSWEVLYTTQPHTQPILSLDVFPTEAFYLTSSADAIIAKHPIPDSEEVATTVKHMPSKSVSTKHSGQQGLRIRSDGKIFATAGWDSKVRVYSVEGMKELAVLKWHKEGCYSLDFAHVDENSAQNEIVAESGIQVLARREGTLTLKEERLRKAQTAHWLAAGSKDGKVSLWDIY